MWPCDDARPIEHCVVNVHAAVAQLMGLDGSEDRDGGLQLVDAGDPERWASLPFGSFPCPSKSAKWTWVKLSYKSRDAGYFQASAIPMFRRFDHPTALGLSQTGEQDFPSHFSFDVSKPSIRMRCPKVK